MVSEALVTEVSGTGVSDMEVLAMVDLAMEAWAMGVLAMVLAMVDMVESGKSMRPNVCDIYFASWSK